ncbi:SUN domain-containing protein 3-like [Pezoporus flaviventris]|uniref:SUN domain-containing protein 3-like n=1 Tax=Pezoporus flaviventris TaxID=889875 RepID=UPI002AAFE88F|nr:SUN domain-containing protein 3-like [Pezoporus flaviventris]
MGVTAVQEVINQVLEKLEESQVPVTDYALRSSGAAVIPECTSPSFRNRAEKVILYSLPLVDYVRSPELILEKENHLGNCWPFHGSQGHVLIKLSVPVIPRAVTMDHVSGPELHGDSMSSAPKDFAVYGVTEEKEEQFLGQFVFLAPLNPTQTFRLKVRGQRGRRTERGGEQRGGEESCTLLGEKLPCQRARGSILPENAMCHAVPPSALIS